MIKKLVQKIISWAIDSKDNPYHPLVWIVGDPKIGEHVYIGGFSEINCRDAIVEIGDYCDIGSFVAINCADSHLRTIERSSEITRRDVVLEDHVFIGSHVVILGGTIIQHHSVIAPGVVLKGKIIPPYSLVMTDREGITLIKEGYYAE